MSMLVFHTLDIAQNGLHTKKYINELLNHNEILLK